MVARGLLDLTFTHISVIHKPRQLCFPAELPPAIAALQLYSEELVAIVAPQHPWAQMPPLPFQVIAQESFIVFKPGSSIRALINAVAQQCGAEVRIRFEVGSALTARALASTGLGVAILPRSEAIGREPCVAAVSIATPQLSGRMLMAYQRDHALSPIAHAFLQLIRQYYHVAAPEPSGDA